MFTPGGPQLAWLERQGVGHDPAVRAGEDPSPSEIAAPAPPCSAERHEPYGRWPGRFRQPKLGRVHGAATGVRKSWRWEDAVRGRCWRSHRPSAEAIDTQRQRNDRSAPSKRYRQFRRFLIQWAPLEDTWCGVATDIEPVVQKRERSQAALDFQLVVDSIPIPVAVTTPTGEVEGLNQLTLSYFGLSLSDLKGWKASEVVHPDDLKETIEAQIGAHMAGTSYNVEAATFAPTAFIGGITYWVCRCGTSLVRSSGGCIC